MKNKRLCDFHPRPITQNCCTIRLLLWITLWEKWISVFIVKKYVSVNNSLRKWVPYGPYYPILPHVDEWGRLDPEPLEFMVNMDHLYGEYGSSLKARMWSGWSWKRRKIPGSRADLPISLMLDEKNSGVAEKGDLFCTFGSFSMLWESGRMDRPLSNGDTNFAHFHTNGRIST